jgi:hypothetical protein
MAHGKKTLAASDEPAGQQLITCPFLMRNNIVGKRKNASMFSHQPAYCAERRPEKRQPVSEKNEIGLMTPDERGGPEPAKRINRIDERMDFDFRRLSVFFYL